MMNYDKPNIGLEFQRTIFPYGDYDFRQRRAPLAYSSDRFSPTVPIAVSRVLEMEARAVASLSSSNSPSKFFVCNSDRLYYDEHITALDLDYELQADQIYFVLPVSKLQYKLSASDKAALAVKASVALQNSASDSTKRSSSLLLRRRKGRQSKYSRFSPVVEEFYSSSEKTVNQRVLPPISKLSSSSEKSTAGLGVSRSGSVRKMQRYSSRRAKMGVRSFGIKFTTIHEDSVLQFQFRWWWLYEFSI